MPNTVRLVPPKGKGSRSKVQNYFCHILRPNTHVTFESYQSLLFLDSNTNRRIKALATKGKRLSVSVATL